MAGRGGPRHTCAYADVYFYYLSNAMFYDVRLHKLVAAQCACSDVGTLHFKRGATGTGMFLRVGRVRGSTAKAGKDTHDHII